MFTAIFLLKIKWKKANNYVNNQLKEAASL